MADMRVACWVLGAYALFLLSAGQEEFGTPEGVESSPEECICVPYYQCTNGSIVQDGASLIDVRMKVEGCGNYLDVCCNPPDLELTNEPVENTGEDKGCGIRNERGVGFRITGDTHNEAQFGEFPWMVAVLVSAEAEQREEEDHSLGAVEIKYLLLYRCGASLIHPSVVLTGAHCVANHLNSSITVRIGEWDSQTNKEIYRHQDRGVAEILIHPGFRKDTLVDDVALLFLSEPVHPADHIGYACLPSQEQVLPHGTRCFASGWGKDAFGKEGKYQAILKKVELPIVEHGKCQHYLRRTRLGYYFKLHHSFMCAGGEKGVDTCKGDGGSPLVCPHPENPQRYVQSGIVAWGIGCLDQATPGVYANVAMFREWIDANMNERDLDTTSYSL